MTLFDGGAGIVVQVVGPATQVLLSLTNVADVPILYRDHKSIITAIGIKESVNFQLAHAIGNNLFFYTFGDLAGNLALEGLSFAGSCRDDTSHGLERIRLWYHYLKLSNYNKPIKIIFGKTIIQALLIEGSFTLDDVYSGVGKWSLKFLTNPSV